MIGRLEPELELYPERETQPQGRLGPPRRFPPTAVGVLTPEPEPESHPRRRFARLWEPRPSILGDFARLALMPVRRVRVVWRSLRRSWSGWQGMWYLRIYVERFDYVMMVEIKR
jgi:hypothetical protein